MNNKRMMTREEMEQHVEWLRHEYKNTHPDDRELRGRLLIAIGHAEEQLKDE